jgi:hypothetical protein
VLVVRAPLKEAVNERTAGSHRTINIRAKLARRRRVLSGCLFSARTLQLSAVRVLCKFPVPVVVYRSARC